MRNTIIISALTIIAGFFIACEKDQGPYILTPLVVEDTTTTTPPPPPPPPMDTPTVFTYTISYGTDISPMLQQNCVQACHNQNHPKLDLRPQASYNQLLTDGVSAPYVNTTTPIQSLLYLHLAGVYTLMPEGGPALSQGKIDSVYTWISQGALNN